MIVNRQYYAYLDPLTQDTEKTADGTNFIYRKAPEGYNIAIVPVNLSTFEVVLSPVRLSLGDCGIITPTPDEDAPTWKAGVMPLAYTNGQLTTWIFALTDVADAATGTTLSDIILVDATHPTYITAYTQIGTDGIKKKVVTYNVPAGVSNFTATFKVIASNGKSADKTLTFLPRTTEGTEVYGLYRSLSANLNEIAIGSDSDTLPYITLATFPAAASFIAGRRQMVASIKGPIDVLDNKYTYFAINFNDLPAGNYSAKVEHLGQNKYFKWVIDADGTRREKIVFYDTDPLTGSGGGGIIADPTWQSVTTTGVFQRQTYTELLPVGYTLGQGQGILRIEIVGAAPEGFTITLINNVYQLKYIVPAGETLGLKYVKLRLTQTNGRYVEVDRSFFVNPLYFYTYIDVNPAGGNNKLRIFTNPQQQGGYKIILEGPNDYTTGEQSFEVFDSIIPPPPAQGDSYVYRNLQNLATILTPGFWIVTQKTNYTDGSANKTLYASFTAPIVVQGFQLQWQTTKPVRDTPSAGVSYYIGFNVAQLVEGSQAQATLYRHVEGQTIDTPMSGVEWISPNITDRTDITLGATSGIINAAINLISGDTFDLIVKAKINGVDLGISSVLHIVDKTTAGVGTTDEAYEDLLGFAETGTNHAPVLNFARVFNTSVVGVASPFPKNAGPKSDGSFQFSDPDGDALTYTMEVSFDGGATWTATLPGWISQTSTTYTVTGPSLMTFKIRMTAKDPGNLSVSDTWNHIMGAP